MQIAIRRGSWHESGLRGSPVLEFVFTLAESSNGVDSAFAPHVVWHIEPGLIGTANSHYRPKAVGQIALKQTPKSVQAVVQINSQESVTQRQLLAARND